MRIIGVNRMLRFLPQSQLIRRDKEIIYQIGKKLDDPWRMTQYYGGICDVQQFNYLLI